MLTKEITRLESAGICYRRKQKKATPLKNFITDGEMI